MIILWDASEDQVVLVRGSKDLQLKHKTVVGYVEGTKHEFPDNLSSHKQTEKEICSLCWASEDGSVLAVGYVDGDIIFWDMSNDISSKDQRAEESANNVVKLQLSSGNRRLPVIVLHWSITRSHNHQGGQLFVYGGDEIGSEEVLTVWFELKLVSQCFLDFFLSCAYNQQKISICSLFEQDELETS